jgi:hypothetical protein
MSKWVFAGVAMVAFLYLTSYIPFQTDTAIAAGIAIFCFMEGGARFERDWG